MDRYLFKKAACLVTLVAFVLTSVMPSYAQSVSMPGPGTMVALSEAFAPPLLKGVKVDADNPFRLEFILDKGHSSDPAEQVKRESTRLIKYFLAAITVPEKDLWVNLSPYEKDRIVPDAFGVTEMGRDLLAQDYLLKQITASLLYPDGKTGKEFWKKIYAEAQQQYGTIDIPVDTFNKVWIVPEKAVVFENKQGAYIVESRLKVMLESDYVAQERAETREAIDKKELNSTAPSVASELSAQEIAKKVLREVVIPVLEKEVNEGANFAQLRQVYNSLILAVWFKDKVKASLLGSAYVDQNKTGGVDIADKDEKQKIWTRYVEAFRQGAYNVIKEEVDPVTQEVTPRKYFSGGFGFEKIRSVIDSAEASRLPRGVLDNAMVVTADMSMAGGVADAAQKAQSGVEASSRNRVALQIWDGIKTELEGIDPEVDTKTDGYLPRLYHLMQRTLASIQDKIDQGIIQPEIALSTKRYQQENSEYTKKLDRPLRVGFFPITGNPVHWEHLSKALVVMDQLNLDTIVFRIQGEVEYKNVASGGLASVEDRHQVAQDVLKSFSPLFRYTDLGLKDNHEGHRALFEFANDLNQDTEAEFVYLMGAETQERVLHYADIYYKEYKQAQQRTNHRFGLALMKRDEYGERMLREDIEKVMHQKAEENGVEDVISVSVVQDPDMDLQTSSSGYYQNGNPIVVPKAVNAFSAENKAWMRHFSTLRAQAYGQGGLLHLEEKYNEANRLLKGVFAITGFMALALLSLPFTGHFIASGLIGLVGAGVAIAGYSYLFPDSKYRQIEEGLKALERAKRPEDLERLGEFFSDQETDGKNVLLHLLARSAARATDELRQRMFYVEGARRPGEGQGSDVVLGPETAPYPSLEESRSAIYRVFSSLERAVEKSALVLREGKSVPLFVSMLGGDPRTDTVDALNVSLHTNKGTAAQVLLYDGRSVGTNTLLLGRMFSRDLSAEEVLIINRYLTGNFDYDEARESLQAFKGVLERLTPKGTLALDLDDQDVLIRLARAGVGLTATQIAQAVNDINKEGSIVEADVIQALMSQTRGLYPSQKFPPLNVYQSFLSQGGYKELLVLAKKMGYSKLMVSVSFPDEVQNYFLYKRLGFKPTFSSKEQEETFEKTMRLLEESRDRGNNLKSGIWDLIEKSPHGVVPMSFDLDNDSVRETFLEQAHRDFRGVRAVSKDLRDSGGINYAEDFQINEVIEQFRGIVTGQSLSRKQFYIMDWVQRFAVFLSELKAQGPTVSRISQLRGFIERGKVIARIPEKYFKSVSDKNISDAVDVLTGYLGIDFEIPVMIEKLKNIFGEYPDLIQGFIIDALFIEGEVRRRVSYDSVDVGRRTFKVSGRKMNGDPLRKFLEADGRHTFSPEEYESFLLGFMMPEDLYRMIRSNPDKAKVTFHVGTPDAAYMRRLLDNGFRLHPFRKMEKEKQYRNRSLYYRQDDQGNLEIEFVNVIGYGNLKHLIDFYLTVFDSVLVVDHMPDYEQMLRSLVEKSPVNFSVDMVGVGAGYAMGTFMPEKFEYFYDSYNDPESASEERSPYLFRTMRDTKDGRALAGFNITLGDLDTYSTRFLLEKFPKAESFISAGAVGFVGDQERRGAGQEPVLPGDIFVPVAVSDNFFETEINNRYVDELAETLEENNISYQLIDIRGKPWKVLKEHIFHAGDQPIKVVLGKLFTVDSLSVETFDAVKKLQDAGVGAVDMEASLILKTIQAVRPGMELYFGYQITDVPGVLNLDSHKTAGEMKKLIDQKRALAVRVFSLTAHRILQKTRTQVKAGMQEGQADAAEAPGGIDLTRDRWKMETQSAGNGFQFKFDPAMIQQLQNASGLTPVIIDVQPMTTTLPAFLGLVDDTPGDRHVIGALS